MNISVFRWGDYAVVQRDAFQIVISSSPVRYESESRLPMKRYIVGGSNSSEEKINTTHLPPFIRHGGEARTVQSDFPA